MKNGKQICEEQTSKMHGMFRVHACEVQAHKRRAQGPRECTHVNGVRAPLPQQHDHCRSLCPAREAVERSEDEAVPQPQHERRMLPDAGRACGRQVGADAPSPSGPCRRLAQHYHEIIKPGRPHRLAAAQSGPRCCRSPACRAVQKHLR